MKIGIIKEGKMILDQTIQELRKEAYKKVSFITQGFSPEKFQMEGATDIKTVGTGAHFIYRGDINYLIHQLNQYHLNDLEISEPTLEEIFIHYYQS